MNPYLPKRGLEQLFPNDPIQGDVDTDDLYNEVCEKYDVYHVVITDPEASAEYYKRRIDNTWGKLLDGQHLIKSNSDKLPEVITDIVVNRSQSVVIDTAVPLQVDEDGIGW